MSDFNRCCSEVSQETFLNFNEATGSWEYQQEFASLWPVGHSTSANQPAPESSGGADDQEHNPLEIVWQSPFGDGETLVDSTFGNCEPGLQKTLIKNVSPCQGSRCAGPAELWSAADFASGLPDELLEEPAPEQSQPSQPPTKPGAAEEDFKTLEEDETSKEMHKSTDKQVPGSKGLHGHWSLIQEVVEGMDEPYSPAPGRTNTPYKPSPLITSKVSGTRTGSKQDKVQLAVKLLEEHPELGRLCLNVQKKERDNGSRQHLPARIKPDGTNEEARQSQLQEMQSLEGTSTGASANGPKKRKKKPGKGCRERRHRQRNMLRGTSGSTIKPHLYFTTLLCITFLQPTESVLPPNPLLCLTTSNQQTWRLPEDYSCPIATAHRHVAPVNSQLQLYRRNLVQYVSNAWLCRKTTHQVMTFSYFFGDENLDKSAKVKEFVDEAECKRMKTFHRCSAGQLTPQGQVWATDNKLDWDYPGGGMYCCRWKKFEATNCFLTTAKVYKRHGGNAMESSAGEVSHCKYEYGSCSLEDGQLLIWEPNKTEICEILPWKKMRGKLLASQWVSNDGNLALTFHDQRRMQDCDRNDAQVSDQGIPFRILQRGTSKKLSHRQGSTVQMDTTTNRFRSVLQGSAAKRLTRLKRGEKLQPTGIVTAEVLAGSLQALETNLREAVEFSFTHALSSTCHSMNNIQRILNAAVSANPTQAMRQLLRHSDIQAKASGVIIEVWPCLALQPKDFAILPMNDTCTTEIPIRYTVANKTRTGYLDPQSNVIHRMFKYEVDCHEEYNIPVTFRNSSYYYRPDGTLTLLQNPQQLSSFQVVANQTLPPELIFHPLIMYHVDELQSHISLNDLFHSYSQQRQVLTLLGVQTGRHSTETTAGNAASKIVQKGLFSFLWELGIDPIQIWIFACCFYVTITLALKICCNQRVITTCANAVWKKISRTIRGVWKWIRYINGNRDGTAIITTLNAQSQLGLPSTFMPLQDMPVRTEQGRRQDKQGSSQPFSPYNLCTMPTSTISDGTVTVYVAGHPIHALIDTGAQDSFVLESIGRRLVKSNAARLTNAPTDGVKSASGHIIAIQGSINVAVKIGRAKRQGSLRIASVLPYDMILGRDFIKRLGPVTVDYERGELRFEDTKIPIRNKTQYEPVSGVTLESTAEQQPFAETIVAGLSRLEGDDPRLLEPCSRNRATLSVIVAPSLITRNSSGQVPLRILNPTRTPIKLHAGTRMATESILNEQQLKDIDLQSHITPSTLCALSENLATQNTSHPKLKDLDLSACSIDEDGKRDLLKLLIEYQDIFSEGDHDLGTTDLVHHGIETSDAAPLRQKPYRTAFSMRDVIAEKIQDMLRNGIIEPSTSEWSSPIVLVKKKDGSWRFCVDYRKLNAVTRKDGYRMKRIDDVMGSLNKAKLFCTLDMQSGYHQIPMYANSKHKTAFVTYEGLYQFKKLPFGLCNAPATFQRLMEAVLAGLDWRICLVYLDDILVMGSSVSELLQRLRQVFERLRLAGLKLKMKKCEFGKDTVPFLGHVLSSEGFFPMCAKVEKVRNWPTPRNAKEVQSFLGLAGYYRQFVWCYSKIAAPLHALYKKNTKFEWTSHCQEAFDTLKKSLSSAPILSFPDFDKYFHIQTDASDESIGAVLSQIAADGKEHPVSFASCTLTKAERRYPVVEKETLGVVWAIRQFRPYIYGRPFFVITDHQPLRWLLEVKDPRGRLCRWSLLLQSYDMTILHRPGKENRNADALSRRPMVEQLELDGKATTCAVCNELYQSKKLREETEDNDTQLNTIVDPVDDKDPSIRKLQLEDPTASGLIWFLESGHAELIPSAFQNRTDEFYLTDGELWHRNGGDKNRDQLYLLVTLREQAFNACHDHLFGGHLGIRKTVEKISARYFWPNMYTQVRKWCKSCEACATKKSPLQWTVPPLHSIPIVAPWHSIACDILTLPQTKEGNKNVVVFMDYFTKWVECFAVPDTKAVRIAKLMVEEVICRYGVPFSILTDQGPNLTSEVMQEVCRLLGIKKLKTTAYNPRCDGMVERFNRTLTNMLSLYVANSQDDWDTILPYVCFAYRSSMQESTGESPYFLNFGRDPALPLDVALRANATTQINVNDYRHELPVKLTAAWESVEEAVAAAQQSQRNQHNKKAKPVPFLEGDRVYLHVPVVAKGKTTKLARLWKGPYRIKQLTEDGLGAFLTPCQHGTRAAAKRINVRRLKKAPDNDWVPPLAQADDETEPTNLEGSDAAQNAAGTSSQPAEDTPDESQALEQDTPTTSEPERPERYPSGRPRRNLKVPQRLGIMALFSFCMVLSCDSEDNGSTRTEMQQLIPAWLYGVNATSTARASNPVGSHGKRSKTNPRHEIPGPSKPALTICCRDGSALAGNDRMARGSCLPNRDEGAGKQPEKFKVFFRQSPTTSAVSRSTERLWSQRPITVVESRGHPFFPSYGAKVFLNSETLWSAEQCFRFYHWRLEEEVETMYMANYHKFIQNPFLFKMLRRTGDSTIVFCSRDRFWGCGLNSMDPQLKTLDQYPGANQLGRILVRLREQLGQSMQLSEVVLRAPAIGPKYGEYSIDPDDYLPCYIMACTRATSPADRITTTSVPIINIREVPTVTLDTDKWSILAMIDTGATMSVIQASWLWHALGKTPSASSGEHMNATTLGRQQITIKGYYNLKFTIGGLSFTHQFAVALYDSPRPIILGYDFLTKQQSILDLQSAQMTIALGDFETE